MIRARRPHRSPVDNSEKMDVLLSLLAFAGCIAGIVGCIVPVLPGPVLSYAGLLCAYACSYSSLGPATMWTWAAATAAVTVVDYFLPGCMTRLFGGTRAGAAGATVGLVAGLFFGGPAGVLAGPFVGAVLGELLHDRREAGRALKVGVGSFLSFLVGTGIKLIASLGMLTYVVADTWPALRAWTAAWF